MVDMIALLKTTIDLGGRELHISPQSPPTIRMVTKLHLLDLQPLTFAEAKESLYSLLRDRDRVELETRGSVSLSFLIKGAARFSGVVSMEMGAVLGVFFVIPEIDQILSRKPSLPHWLTSFPTPGLHLVGSRSRYGLDSLLVLLQDRFAKHGKKVVKFSSIVQARHFELGRFQEFRLRTGSLHEVVSRAMDSAADLILFSEAFDVEIRRIGLDLASRGVPVVYAASFLSCASGIEAFCADVPGYILSSFRGRLAQLLQWVFVRNETEDAKGEPLEVCDYLRVDTQIRRLIEGGRIDFLSKYIFEHEDGVNFCSAHYELVRLLDLRRISFEQAAALVVDPQLLQIRTNSNDRTVLGDVSRS